ncbi:MAG: hypothetical protein AAFR76_10975, partial [Planctomycetota bacterium]
AARHAKGRGYPCADDSSRDRAPHNHSVSIAECSVSVRESPAGHKMCESEYGRPGWKHRCRSIDFA